MNYFNKKRITIWVIVILAVLNIAAISTITYHIVSNKKLVEVVMDLPRRNMNFLVGKELNLNDEQQVQFVQFKHEYAQASKAILERLRERRIEMLEELSKDESDVERLDEIAEEIGNLHAELKRKTIIHFLDMKKVCNPDQMKQLNVLFHDMIHCRGHFEGPPMGRRGYYGRRMKNQRNTITTIEEE